MTTYSAAQGGRDKLYGGPGYDTANGDLGIDRCVAEVRIDCIEKMKTPKEKREKARENQPGRGSGEGTTGMQRGDVIIGRGRRWDVVRP